MSTNKKCEHGDRCVEYMPKGYIHYAKIKCEDCGIFIKWVKNPNITKEVDRRNEKIDRILEEETLNDFETEFLKSIRKRRILTVKQENCYNDIIMKYK